MHSQRFISLILAAAPVTLPAQAGLPGTNVTATVRVRAVSMVGDTTTITTSVAVSFASLERLAGFAIQSSAPIRAIQSTGVQWLVFRNYAGVAGPSWWDPNPPVARGDSTPSLTFSATGVPGTAAVFLAGDSMIIAASAEYVPAYHPLFDLARKSEAIGIYPVPTGGATALVAWLQAQGDSACAIGWISSGTLCSTLHGQSANVNYNSIRQYGTSLDSARSHGSAVSDAAYFLLKPNASYSLAHLPPPPLTDSISGDTATSIYTAHPSGGTPGYSYLWEWCTTNCGGSALRAQSGGPPPAVVPNTVGNGWSNVGYTTASICWTMSQSTLRSTVTDAKGVQAIAYYSVPVLQHVCGGP